MTNMMPQAPGNNQGPWEKLESYQRTLVGQNSELYIVAAGVGTGGTGSNGGITQTLSMGRITVPSYTWKVIMVLSVGDNDVARVDNNTRVFGVIMPNLDNIRPDAWEKYLATVDQVEALTGYDFFSNVSPAIQKVIEARLDTISSTAPQTVAGGSYTDLDITAPNTTLSGNITVTGNLRLGGSTLNTGNFCVTLGTGATVTRISGYVNGCVEKQFPATVQPTRGGGAAAAETAAKETERPALAPFEYPVGTANGYSPVTATVTNAAANSSLAVKAVQSAQPNAPNPATALKRYWTLTETGDLTADLQFKYLDADVPNGVAESDFTLQRYENGFTQIPATIDPPANTAATGISQFSDWTLLAPTAPTAATVAVSGRVTLPDEFGITQALVTLTNARGITRTVVTGKAGRFGFTDVPAGEIYIITVKARRAQYAPQVISVTEDLAGLTFIPVPNR